MEWREWIPANGQEKRAQQVSRQCTKISPPVFAIPLEGCDAWKKAACTDRSNPDFGLEGRRGDPFDRRPKVTWVLAANGAQTSLAWSSCVPSPDGAAAPFVASKSVRSDSMIREIENDVSSRGSGVIAWIAMTTKAKPRQVLLGRNPQFIGPFIMLETDDPRS